MSLWPAVGQLYVYIYSTVFILGPVKFVFLQTVSMYEKEGLSVIQKFCGREHPNLCIATVATNKNGKL